MADIAKQSILERALRAIPILGYLIRCLTEERPKELVLLLVNIAMAIAILVLLFGLPAYVTIIYGLLVTVGFFIFLTTLS